MISTISMIIIIIIISNSGIIFSFYGFVKLLLMQSLHSCFPRAATGTIHVKNMRYNQGKEIFKKIYMKRRAL